MKPIIRLLLSALFLVLFSGCGNRQKKSESTQNQLVEDSVSVAENGFPSEVEPAMETRITAANVHLVSEITENENPRFFDPAQPLTDYLKIELIDKSVFESKKSSVVTFLLADTTAIVKKNGVLELPAQNKTVTFADRYDEETGDDEMCVFEYVGQVEFLNQYLLRTTYWEAMDYRFIDKTSGEETVRFCEYPVISPDKKHIICILANAYDRNAWLQLYSINEQSIKLVADMVFVNWMPSFEPDDIFWSSDGYVYFAANHINAFWTESGDINDEYQYIRMAVRE